MKFPEKNRWCDAPNRYNSWEGEPYGVFRIPGNEANGRELYCMAQNYMGREEVAILAGSPEAPENPSPEEIIIVKNIFWDHPSESVGQSEPKITEGASNYWGCVHLVNLK